MDSKRVKKINLIIFEERIITIIGRKENLSKIFRSIAKRIGKHVKKIKCNYFYVKKETHNHLDERRIFSKFRQMMRKFDDPFQNGKNT